MIWGSTSEFILAMMRAGQPASAWARSRSIRPVSRWREVTWRDDQLVPVVRLGVARQEVEERAGILAELATTGEEAQVGILPRGRRVVVPGGQVDVPPDAVVFAADDQGRLAMGLESDDPVDDVDARLLEHAGLVDVVLLVESGLELDQGRHLFAILGGTRQGGDDRVGLGRAVEGHLDRQRLGIFRGLLEKLHDRAERLVRVVDQDIVVADGGENALTFGQWSGHLWLVEGLLEVAEPLHLAESQQHGQVDWAGDLVDVATLELQGRRG